MTEAVGDMALERPTQSGVDLQCQDLDGDTPSSPVCTPSNSPSVKKNCIVKSVKSVIIIAIIVIIMKGILYTFL